MGKERGFLPWCLEPIFSSLAAAHKGGVEVWADRLAGIFSRETPSWFCCITLASVWIGKEFFGTCFNAPQTLEAV